VGENAKCPLNHTNEIYPEVSVKNFTASTISDTKPASVNDLREHPSRAPVFPGVPALRAQAVIGRAPIISSL